MLSILYRGSIAVHVASSPLCAVCVRSVGSVSLCDRDAHLCMTCVENVADEAVACERDLARPRGVDVLLDEAEHVALDDLSRRLLRAGVDVPLEDSRLIVSDVCLGDLDDGGCRHHITGGGVNLVVHCEELLSAYIEHCSPALRDHLMLARIA